LAKVFQARDYCANIRDNGELARKQLVVHRLISIGVDRLGGDRMFRHLSREMEKLTIPLEASREVDQWREK
jgi:hypothetical protein